MQLSDESPAADHGSFNTLTASSTIAEAHALTNELCVNDDAGVPVCVTGTQLRSLVLLMADNFRLHPAAYPRLKPHLARTLVLLPHP